MCIDRDPQAEEHFTELAGEVACATRFIAGNYADVLPDAARRRGCRRTSSIWTSASPRCRWTRGSAASPIPTKRRSTCAWTPSQELDARTILNEWPEARLAATIREYGEERYARRIAREIVRRRERAPIDTTAELVEAIKRAVPTPAQFAGGHPARRTFQAIRIAVNDELGSLERALPAAWELLRPGGRMAVISFHSLEDRLVKRFFAELARGCMCPPELPVCVCGHEPEAELVTPQAGAPERGRSRRQPALRSRAACAPRSSSTQEPGTSVLERSGS